MSLLARHIVTTVLASFMFFLVKDARSAAVPTYSFLKEIAVGGSGGWDYLSIDADARRLYVTHASKILVIDIDTDTLVGEIADTPGVHGFAVAQDLGRGYSSNGAESQVSIVDLKTLKTVAKVATGSNPDAIVYDPDRHEVYVFNGRGKSMTVIDAKSDRVVTTLPLPGKPEFAVIDTAAHRVYDNIEDTNEVIAIDTATHRIVHRWPIAPGEGASGMAFDAAHHRLFLGAENKLMVVLDSTNGRVIGSVPIGSGVDANAFDPATGLAFSANGEGNVTIAHEDSPNKLTVVQTLETARGARTMALDPKTHKIYLATAQLAPAPAAVPGSPRQRPTIVPDTFRILVYAIAQQP